MGIAIVTFVALFLFIASAGALLFYREAMMKRLASVVSPDVQAPNRLARVRAAGASIGALVEPIERVLPRSAEETSIVRTRLTRAGYRKDSHLRVFLCGKSDGSRFALRGTGNSHGRYIKSAHFLSISWRWASDSWFRISGSAVEFQVPATEFDWACRRLWTSW